LAKPQLVVQFDNPVNGGLILRFVTQSPDICLPGIIIIACGIERIGIFGLSPEGFRSSGCCKKLNPRKIRKMRTMPVIVFLSISLYIPG